MPVWEATLISMNKHSSSVNSVGRKSFSDWYELVTFAVSNNLEKKIVAKIWRHLVFSDSLHDVVNSTR